MRNALKFLEYWEKSYPYILSTIITIVIYKYIPLEMKIKIFSGKIFEPALTLSGILFGFLITILSLLLQMTNRSLKMIRDLNKFDLLISYNKQAVYNSALAMIFSLVQLVISPNESTALPTFCLELFIGYLWLCSVICMITNTYRYTSLFFRIVRS